MENLKIAMTGSTGFIGTNLSAAFAAQGRQVVPITRADLAGGAGNLAEKMRGAGVVVNLAGATVIALWTKSHKKEMYDSRINTTSLLVRAFEMMPSKPPLFISTSAVGFYAAEGKHTEENFKHADDFLGTLTSAWEAAAMKAVPLGVRTVVFRFGIVLGRGGGALAKMLFPFKLGIAGTIGDGSQAFSWVQIKDLERAYMTAIADGSFSGVYNLTAPNPTTNRGLTKALGKALHRPTVLPLPKFVLRLVYGEGAAVLTSGQEVYPKRLLEAGFKFSYPDIDSAVKASIP